MTMWDRKVHNSMRDRFRQHRPDWWPENETWPPVRSPHWRRMSHRFVRRMGCLFMLATFLASFIFVVLLTFVAKSLGIIQIPNTFWWVIPGGVVLFFFGIWLLIMTARSLRRLSAPLGDLVEAADRISAGDFSAEVPERGSGEMRSLVRAFNGMASRLKLTEEQRRDLMADITHELRTPITIIQGNVEGIIDGVYAADEVRLKSILEETQILSRLVEDLRTLALAESGALQLKKEPTDMTVLIGDTVAAFRTEADEAGVSLEIQTSANTSSGECGSGADAAGAFQFNRKRLEVYAARRIGVGEV